jgi:hypothetical protein
VDKICPYKDGKGRVKIIEKIVDNSTSYSYLAFASYHKSNLVYKCIFLLILLDHKHARRIFLYIKFLRICKIPCPACMPMPANFSSFLCVWWTCTCVIRDRIQYAVSHPPTCDLFFSSPNLWYISMLMWCGTRINWGRRRRSKIKERRN